MPSEAGPQSPQQSTPPPPSSPSSSDGNADGADFVHSKPQEEQLWHEFGNPEKPVNLIPGGTTRPTAAEAQRNTEKSLSAEPLSVEGLKNVHKTPCARDSLLVGIAGGLGVGSIKAMVGGIKRQGVWPACNFAVGGFAALSLATYELCQYQRRREIEGMKEANELMKKLRAKKEKEKEAAQAAAEQEKWQKSWMNPAKYKFW